MTEELGELLSAFADGETVDPDRLVEALHDPDAVALLVTCARLRAEIRNDASRPSPAFYERMQAVLRPRGLRRFLAIGGATLPWPIAAGAAAATLVAGLVTGSLIQPGTVARVSPPPEGLTPTSTSTASQPSPAPVAQSSLASATPEHQVRAPAPTRLFRFTSAGEWREGV